MEYERLDLLNLSSMKPIESRDVTLIWARDGWCYIPQLKLRQRFTETNFYLESWNGVIGLPCSVEQIQLAVYSKEPRIWEETGADHHEAYKALAQGSMRGTSLNNKKKIQTNRTSTPAKQ
jgi:hypothetical protein